MNIKTFNQKYMNRYRVIVQDAGRVYSIRTDKGINDINVITFDLNNNWLIFKENFAFIPDVASDSIKVFKKLLQNKKRTKR